MIKIHDCSLLRNTVHNSKIIDSHRLKMTEKYRYPDLICRFTRNTWWQPRVCQNKWHRILVQTFARPRSPKMFTDLQVFVFHKSGKIAISHRISIDLVFHVRQIAGRRSAYVHVTLTEENYEIRLEFKRSDRVSIHCDTY